MVRPNGLVFTPDKRLSYVLDTAAFNIPGGPHHIRVYEFVGNRYVKNGRVFAVIEPGKLDELRVDEYGNVFTSSQDSVQIYATDETYLGKIFVPEISANLIFSGKNRESLLITAGHCLYALDLNIRGVQL
jgi:gluconolactonase